MSRISSQQCGHPSPDNGAYDPRSKPTIPMRYGLDPHFEPRYFVPPDEGYNDRSFLVKSSQTRLPPLKKLPETSTDTNNVLSSDKGYTARHLSQKLPLRMHDQDPVVDIRGYPTPCEEISNPMLNQSREPDACRMLTYDREARNSSTNTQSPVYTEKGLVEYSDPTINSQEPKAAPKNQGYSIPHGFDKLLHIEPESSPPPTLFKNIQSRYHLHVRQQPITARACGTGGRDRRPVDPPPIVQVLLTDFDPESQDDRDILKDPRLTVGCLLFPASECSRHLAKKDKDHPLEVGDGDGVARTGDTFSTPLLYGKAFMSPFFVDADPYPNSAPTHPFCDNPHRVPSPDISQPENRSNASKSHRPATFFIFADLSIRSAGLYRLQFRLMNWGSVEDTGQSMPILAEAWSASFRVYRAKDFPGMRDSSVLADGLKELGAWELKTRGKGKGRGRKT